LILATFLLRISALLYPFLDSDESIFAVIAKQLLNGGALYRDGLDNKPPFIFLFYWFHFLIAGHSAMFWVHFTTICLSIFESILLFKIASEQADEKSGYFAALFFAVFSTTYTPKYIATSVNAVMIVPLTLACLYWLRGEKSFRLKDDFLAGLFTGIAFLLKYQGGIQLALFFIALIPFLRQRKEEISVSIIRMFVCLGGFFVPIVLTVGGLALGGVLEDFWTWTLMGSFSYIRAGSETIPFFTNLLVRGGTFILATALLWLLAFRRRSSPFLLLWFFLTLIPVCMGNRFYGHYFIQLLPPLCLLAGIKASQIQSAKALKWMGIAIIFPAFVFWILRADLKRIDELFPDDQLFEQQSVGEWLKKNTNPAETLFVWGNSPAIYYFSDLKPASRFIFTESLTGKIQGSRQSIDAGTDIAHYARLEAWDILWADFLKNPPTYVVDTSPADFHDYQKFPINHYPPLFEYLQNRYVFWKNISGCPVYKIKR
ncbi:MAG: glycosyltransferase family 39 protein, partial [bacterium]|nr:glycosyltransferase family 39 protein [bacterium]